MFLFGEAHEEHWRLQPGDLLAIFQPKVSLPRSGRSVPGAASCCCRAPTGGALPTHTRPAKHAGSNCSQSEATGGRRMHTRWTRTQLAGSCSLQTLTLP